MSVLFLSFINLIARTSVAIDFTVSPWRLSAQISLLVDEKLPFSGWTVVARKV